jgi:hypothetical protein
LPVREEVCVSRVFGASLPDLYLCTHRHRPQPHLEGRILNSQTTSHHPPPPRTNPHDEGGKPTHHLLYTNLYTSLHPSPNKTHPYRGKEGYPHLPRRTAPQFKHSTARFSDTLTRLCLKLVLPTYGSLFAAILAVTLAAILAAILATILIREKPSIDNRDAAVGSDVSQAVMIDPAK